MSSTSAWSSGKTHRDENFPVASRLIAPRYRGAVLAFYRFARAADDIADHPALPAEDKLRLLDDLEGTLFGSAEVAEAIPLRDVLARRGLSARHPCDLLTAFRMDVARTRYADWSDLMDYCAYSAMPVGRMVLDIHGEMNATWPASDALCAALQVINHLQDCGKDYRDLGRVYLPLETLAEHGARVEDLGAERATPELRAAIADLAGRTAELLEMSASLPQDIQDRRLSIEVDVIRRLAAALVERLRLADPLNESVHLGRRAMLWAMAAATMKGARRWLERPAAKGSRVEVRR